jgi:hypothetical protein
VRHAASVILVIYPFTYDTDTVKSEYLAEVVRVEQTESQPGVAVRLIATI